MPIQFMAQIGMKVSICFVEKQFFFFYLLILINLLSIFNVAFDNQNFSPIKYIDTSLDRLGIANLFFRPLDFLS